MSTLTAEGNKGAGDAGGTGAGAGAGGTGGTGGAGGTASWRDALPADLKDNPSLAVIQDIPSLAKSYVHAQSQVGKKGVVLPGEKATEEEWGAFFKGVGVPEVDKYEVVKPKDYKASDEVMAKFKKAAHEAGLLPRQAEKVLAWYAGEEAASEQVTLDALKVEREVGMQALQKKWGEGYGKELHKAKRAVQEVGGEKIVEMLEETGLGDDPDVIEFFNRIGGLMGEDKLRGDGSGKMGGSTPSELESEIRSIRESPEYYDTKRPGHAAAVAKAAQLYQKLYA